MRRFTRLVAIMAIVAFLASADVFAFSLPFFGFDAAKESAKLIGRIEKGDYKGLAEDIDGFNAELAEEIADVKAGYEKDLDRLEEKVEEAAGKMFGAKDESRFNRYAEQLDELSGQYDDLEDEMRDEIALLASHEITDDLVYDIIVANADSAGEAWEGVDFMHEARGVVTAYANLTYEGAGRTWTVEMDEAGLASRTIDMSKAMADIEKRTGGRFSGMMDEDGEVFTDPASVRLDDPWGKTFTLSLEVDVSFDMNGLDGTDDVTTMTMDIADGIPFPSARGGDGKVFLGWAKSRTVDGPDEIYGEEDDGLTLGQTGSGAVFYAQYAAFSAAAQIQDLEGNRNGIAQVGERISISPVVTNEGTMPASFALSLTEGTGDGFSVLKVGRPSISYEDLEPGESVMVTGGGTYLGKPGETLGGTRWSRNLARDRWDVQISPSAGAGVLSIPVTIDSAGETVETAIPLGIENGAFLTRIGLWDIDDEDGNGDGRLNPGEEVGLDFSLGLASGSDDAYDVTLQVTTSDPKVKITGGGIGEVGDLDEDHVYISRKISFAQLDNLKVNNLSPDRKDAIRISIPQDAQIGSEIVLTVTARDNLGLESVNTIGIPVQGVDGSVRLRNWEWKVAEGNEDSVFNAGETARVGYNVENDGDALLEDVVLTFSCDDEDVVLQNSTVRSATLRKDNCLMPGQVDRRDFAASTRTSDAAALLVTIPSDWDASLKSEVVIRWNVTSRNCPEGGWSGEFSIPVSQPANIFELVGYETFIGDEEAMSWAMPVGTPFSIDFFLKNAGRSYINDVAVSWESESPYLTIDGQQRARARSISTGWYLKYSDMSSNVISRGYRANDAVLFTISPDAPDGEVVVITAVVTDGWQTWRFPLEVAVARD